MNSSTLAVIVKALLWIGGGVLIYTGVATAVGLVIWLVVAASWRPHDD